MSSTTESPDEKIKKLKALLAKASTHIDQYKVQIKEYETVLLEKDVKITQLKKDNDKQKEEIQKLEQINKEQNNIVENLKSSKRTPQDANNSKKYEENLNLKSKLSEMAQTIQNLEQQIEENDQQLAFFLDKFKKEINQPTRINSSDQVPSQPISQTPTSVLKRDQQTQTSTELEIESKTPQLTQDEILQSVFDDVDEKNFLSESNSFLLRNNSILSSEREELRLAHMQISHLTEIIKDQKREEELKTKQTGFLKNEIRELERSKARESVNLDYLKNILVKYFEASDMKSKQALLTVISTILHFSPEELLKINQAQSSATYFSRAVSIFN